MDYYNYNIKQGFEPELNRKPEKTVIFVGTKTGAEPKKNIGLFRFRTCSNARVNTILLSTSVVVVLKINHSELNRKPKKTVIFSGTKTGTELIYIFLIEPERKPKRKK